MKIAIIGNCGSGKSTLGRTLHTLLNIPVYHLDQYFWKADWQEPDRAEFEKIHKHLCDQDQWIIDGMALRFFDYRIQQADVIIFIDIPTYKSLYRVFKRAYTHFGNVYFASANNCPERYPDFKFLKYIINFNRKQRRYIIRLLDQYRDHKNIFVVSNKADIDELIKQLTSDVLQ